MLALLIALLVPTRAGRRPLRDAARVAMGVAFIVAGVSHLAMPDPFVQHLPDWVPSREDLIALTTGSASRRLWRQTLEPLGVSSGSATGRLGCSGLGRLLPGR